ncbi:AAA family ATPase [Amycolatopsis sp. cmx-11-51]|uniref:AAA family ATPase n=1 Tax=unclassified Amycolatopsis TaxID=2618356 RepID=UPI0039E3EAED
MDISALSNPYDYANPVSDENVFAGRRPELSQVATVLAAADPDKPVGYVAVHGQRAAGKTSLLNMIELMAKERDCPVVRLDLVPADAGLLPFVGKFYEEVLGAVSEVADLGPATPRRIRRIAGGEVPEDDFPLEFPENLAQARSGAPLSEMALRTDLTYLVTRAERPIVVLVDEAQLIADNEDVLSLLRTLGMQLRGFVFVLAGTTELIDRINVVFDHLLRQFEFVEVARFAETAEIEDCAARPLTAAGLDVAECFSDIRDTANNLAMLTDGNPYEIQFYCHTMFSRWQRGVTKTMKLTPEALDDVLAIMDKRRLSREHALLDAVKTLTHEQLLVLNVLCSARDRATLAEALFAHHLYVRDAMAPEVLDRCRDDLVKAKIIEIDNGRVRFAGSMFDEIYIRLWTMSGRGAESVHSHTQLMNSLPFNHLMSRQLDFLLCDLTATTRGTLLRTCCPGMSQDTLGVGLKALASLSMDAPGNHTVAYLYEGIVRAGFPAALDITELTCVFGDNTAIRWITSADMADFDIEREPAFIATRRAVERHGGRISVERLRQPLAPWPQLREWLIQTEVADLMTGHSDYQLAGAFTAFEEGDLAKSIELFQTAHRLRPRWRSANDCAFVLLCSTDPGEAARWAVNAIELADTADERSLSRYNLAIAEVFLGEHGKAVANFQLAADEIKDSYDCSYLFVPERDESGTLVVKQHETIDVGSAIRFALMALVPSTEPDTVVGQDEAGGPAGG